MNQINVIYPYRYCGGWVFDDEARGLIKEPFVAGADTVMDILSAGADRFSLTFSGAEFPGVQHRFDWQREEFGGNWYRHSENGMEGWLCPALFLYFDSAPKSIFLMVREAV
jgi:hypothetical protein